jgi:hypothetical protein
VENEASGRLPDPLLQAKAEDGQSPNGPMKRPCSRLLTLGVLVFSLGSLLPPPAALARGGGGGGGGGGFRGGGGGGGFHFGGEGYDGRGSSEGWMRGYQGDHPHYGPNTRPAWDKKEVDIDKNFYNRNGDGWNANWANGGYWANRPWNAGWYAWTPATWGWWGWNTVGWGLAGVATGVTITSLVNEAANRQQTVILVPSSTYLLNYASVEAVGFYGASFAYSLGQTDSLMGAANCQAGLLNGQVPATAAQAQLLNAVCQVAYGGGS